MDPFFGGIFFDDLSTEDESPTYVRRYRTRFDFYALTDRQVMENFRLRRESILMLHERIKNNLSSSYINRSTDLTPLQQLLIAIRFYATGDHYQTLALSFGVVKQTISVSITRVTNALFPLASEYIRFPTGNELAANMNGFYRIARMPQVIGAVDGTLFRIVRPKNQPDSPWICRKGYPSVNAMAVCDSVGRFMYFMARHPGSCHDSYVLRSSQLWQFMEGGGVNAIILGDSGYALRRWLFTPIRNPQDAAEMRYNRRHRNTRVIVEQAFGRLKMAWRFLHNECRLEPIKLCKIATICAMFQNIRIDTGVTEEVVFDELPPDDLPHDDQQIGATQTPAQFIQYRRNYVLNNFNGE